MFDRTRRFEQTRFAFVAEEEHLFACCVHGLRPRPRHWPIHRAAR